MPEDNKGGSDAENKTAQISIDQAMAENVALKKERDDLKSTITTLTAQLKAANDVLEGQTKAELIGKIVPRSRFTIEDLDKKSVDELKEICATLDQATLPTYKNIHFGSLGADEKDERLTIGDLSVVTEAKRKAGGA